MEATKQLFIGLTVLLALAGCHELGHVEVPRDYGNVSNEIVGEVQNVDSRGRQIEIRADSGRMVALRYDNNTQVIYRQLNYPVTNLERGDYVAAKIQQDRDGRNYTSTIMVREIAQDRGYTSRPRLDRVEGRVEYIDNRRGTFEIRDSRNRLIIVSVPFNAPQSVLDRFNRLRNGDLVRVEGKAISPERFDAENFL